MEYSSLDDSILGLVFEYRLIRPITLTRVAQADGLQSKTHTEPYKIGHVIQQRESAKGGALLRLAVKFSVRTTLKHRSHSSNSPI